MMKCSDPMETGAILLTLIQQIHLLKVKNIEEI